MAIKEFCHEDVSYQNVEIIIFNFDGVLYSSQNFDKFYADYLATAVSKLSIDGLTPEEAKFALEYHKVIGGNGYDRKAFRQVCEERLGVLQSDFDHYYLTHPFVLPRKDIVTISNDLLKELSQKYALYIATNDWVEVLKRKAKILQIDLDVFINALMPIDGHSNSFNKASRIHFISRSKLLHPSEIYAVGTNFYEDIEPLYVRNGSGVVVDTSDCKLTEKFLREKFLGGKNGTN